MARSRNIKPGFFTNDALGELPPLTRLLFAGIWTLCDREGRLEDRPRKIRAEILPYDQCDAEDMLQQLHDSGFIKRYKAGDTHIIQVLAWDKHQNPHIKEAASTLPAPDGHQTKPVQKPSKQAPPPERAGLIPSPLTPDSLSSDSIDSVPNGTGGKPPMLTDPKEIIFGYGLSMLVNAGTPEKQARSFLGGLAKHHGEPELIDKLRECAKARPLQPLEWLAAALPPAGPKPKLNKQEALEASNREVARRFIEKLESEHEQE